MRKLTIDKHGEIAVVTLDNPPVNALGQALRQEIWDTVEMLDADPSVQAVVLIGAGRTFIAGADISEFDMPPAAPHLPELVDRIEAAAKPWIAAIHGSALGGGFEVAMGCRFRVALEGALVGLPEVSLGLVPGASGTVRTPRLAGIPDAVDLVTSGRPILAERAKEIGLIDSVIAGDLLATALDFVRAKLNGPLPPPVSARTVAVQNDAWWAEKRDATAKRAKGETAPLRALDCLRTASERPFAQALAYERATFLELRGSDQAAALRHVFFAERAAPKPAHIGNQSSLPMRSAAVIGGGTMGAGIAASLREAGLPVVLIERDEDAMARGLVNIRGIFDGAVKRGKLTQAQAVDRMQGISAGCDYTLLADVDLVIEAVFEDFSTKRAVFDQLGQTCRRDAVLATNTSYLDPRLIAQGLPNPARFIGLHFFSPAHVMKLLEIIPTPDTAVEVLATGFALARKIGKIPVQSGICEGFIGNRILKRYRFEAELLVRQGVSIMHVDAAMRGYGFAMGPFESQDLGGLDIAFLQREGARAMGQSVAETLGDILVRAGRKGQKSGGGWYDYAPNDRTARPSQTVQALLGDAIGVQMPLGPDAIVERLTTAMAHEGAAILSEGIALKSSDIDLVQVHGYGFPRWRGGPMFAATRHTVPA